MTFEGLDEDMDLRRCREFPVDDETAGTRPEFTPRGIIACLEPSTAAASYRPEIDGLRAVAVLSVVIFHAFEGLAPGGFVGVDVFFVISGFLISGIIRRSLASGSFSLSDFYARRARRILPALLLVLVACLGAGWAFWLADEWQSLGRHVFAGALFHANIAVADESTAGYFVALGGRNALLHLWSLGVEEQFYLAWPLVFAALVRWTRWPLIGVLLIFAGSFALNVMQVTADPANTYFLPFTRLWELLAGAALIFIRRPLTRVEAEIASVLGLALIVFSCLTFDWAATFPGWRALAPTAGAALIILAGPRAWLCRNVLSAPAVVWIGLISYPLYLWHWPALVFGRAIWMDARFWPGTLMLVVASFALAHLTYRIVERPVRASPGWPVPATMLGALVVIALTGKVIAGGGTPSRLTLAVPSAPQLIAATSDWSYPHAGNFRRKSGFTSGEDNPGRDRAVLFVGDSYLEQYWARVNHVVSSAPAGMPTVRFFTRGGCVPLRHEESRGPVCGRFLDEALAAAMDPSVDTVVFGAFWESYFKTGRIGEAAVRPLMGVRSQAADNALSHFSEDVRRLREAGKQVFVLLTGPTEPAFDPRFLVSRLTGERRNDPVSVGPWRKQAGPVLTRVYAAAAAAGAVVLDPVPYVCEGEDCPVVGANGEPTHVDRGHMRPWYVIERAAFLDQTLRDPRAK
jgi:peptidoglycan/LPS O-acetylase OafA/YrhL